MRHRFIFISMTFLGILFASCNDWLDVQPEDQRKEDDMFSHYKGYRNALSGCYAAMGHTSVYGQKLTTSDIELLAGMWEMMDNSGMNYDLTTHNYNDGVRSTIQDIYSKMFNVIVQTNKIIAHAEADGGAFPDEATRSVILGEAYAIRAYCQLDVLRLFGEVPGGDGEKVSLPYSEVKAFDERATRYDFSGYAEKLLTDLKRAEDLLKDNDPIFQYTYSFLNTPAYFEKALEDTYMAYRQSRLNYWAVKALQARTYLYLGRTGEAYAAAKAVIDAKDKENRPVMELSGHTDRGQRRYACPGECLFYLSKHDIKAATSMLAANPFSAERSNLLISVKRLTEKLFPENKDSDSRYTQGWNKQVEVNGLKDMYAAIRKYYYDVDNVTDASLYYEIVPMLRMAEVVLIGIETTPDVQEANKWYADYLLKGCGVAGDDRFTSQTDRLEVLLPEYAREFFAEGQMFYAYKRVGASETLFGEKIAPEDYVLWNCVNTEFNP